MLRKLPKFTELKELNITQLLNLKYDVEQKLKKNLTSPKKAQSKYDALVKTKGNSEELSDKLEIGMAKQKISEANLTLTALEDYLKEVNRLLGIKPNISNEDERQPQ